MENQHEIQLNEVVSIILQSEGIEYFMANYFSIREEFFANKYSV